MRDGFDFLKTVNKLKFEVDRFGGYEYYYPRTKSEIEKIQEVMNYLVKWGDRDVEYYDEIYYIELDKYRYYMIYGSNLLQRRKL